MLLRGKRRSTSFDTVFSSRFYSAWISHARVRFFSCKEVKLNALKSGQQWALSFCMSFRFVRSFFLFLQFFTREFQKKTFLFLSLSLAHAVAAAAIASLDTPTISFAIPEPTLRARDSAAESCAGLIPPLPPKPEPTMIQS